MAESKQPPKALWIWDNAARLSLPRGLVCWLALLVSTTLGSLAFIQNHVPARLLFCGFVLSHIVVFGLGIARAMTIRRGFVSLTHVVFWSPGWFAILLDVFRGDADSSYLAWCLVVIVVMGISLFLDVSDAAIYIKHVFKGRKPQ